MPTNSIIMLINLSIVHIMFSFMWMQDHPSDKDGRRDPWHELRKSPFLRTPRGQNSDFGGYETWAVVQAYLVSTCSGTPPPPLVPEQLLGGLPWQKMTEMAANFQHGRHLKVMRNFKAIEYSTLHAQYNHSKWGIVLIKYK